MRTYSKAILAMAVLAGIGGTVLGQAYTPTYSPQNPASPAWDPGARPVAPPPAIPAYLPAPQPQVPQLSDDQVANLTASIALYPDPLLAIMLPAATYVSEVTEAQRWVRGNPSPDEWAIQNLPYQPSVKALIHYPGVLQMMAEHPDWTQALGLAFVYQSGDVVNSIQRWRATALQTGTLASTREQQVIQQGGVIQIVPAAQDTVYVPVYDPGMVYVKRPWWDRGPVMRFREGGRPGGWLDYDMDWRDRVVRMPTRPYWERQDWDAHRWDNDRRDDHRDTRWDNRGTSGWNDRQGADRRWDDRGRPVNPRGWEEQRPTAPPARAEAPRVIGPAPGQEKKVFVRDGLKPGVAYPQRVAPPAGKPFVPSFKMENPDHRH